MALRRRNLRVLSRAALLLLLLVACGSRTGLFIDGAPGPLNDAGSDGPRFDSGRDGPIGDALPPIDARPPQDVVRNDCPDADATLVYVVTTEQELFSFFPTDGSFKFIGNLVCPAPAGETPFSMAVDRKGVAYVMFTDEHLYRVSTLNAACVQTPFLPRQSNFGLFGMGFATDTLGPSETLYVAGDARNNSSAGLARIDVTKFKLTPVGNFSPTIDRAELTGTGDGRLFAFYTKGNDSPPSFIGEIATGTAKVIAENRFDTVDQGQGWAFAFWGGDFYMFTAPDGVSSTVTRFRLTDNSVTVVGNLATRIVGAGVSTCAPQQ